MILTFDTTDFILVNPFQGKRIYQELDQEFTAIEPPIWCGLIATYIRKKGYSVRIIDANAECLEADEIIGNIENKDCQLIALIAYGHNPSASTQTMPAIIEIAKALNKAGYQNKTILLGGHIAALPEQSLQETNLNFACLGEGPITLVELLETINKGSTNFDNVPDLIYRNKDGSFVKTKTKGFIRNLDDEMPGIAWDLLPMHLYRSHNWHSFGHLNKRQPYASLYTSLGCPFACHFCCINAPFQYAKSENMRGNVYRKWSTDSIMKQLKILVEDYKVCNIKFADEIFLLNRTHVKSICEAIIKEGYDLNIWAYARVDFDYDQLLLNLMKQAGIRWLCLGIEAGSSRVRAQAHKDFFHDHLFKAIRLIKEAGIYIIGNYMFGLPEDDLTTMQETLNLAKQLNCEYANFYGASAYPGSQLYRYAILNKWPLPDSWEAYAQLSRKMRPLPTNYISGEEVLRFRDRAFVEYFSNPLYLEMIRSKFGQVEVDHIQRMLCQKVERINS